PAMVRDDGDTTIFFDWREHGPASFCLPGSGKFSVRWSRRVAFGNGFYRFRVLSGGGARVFVAGNLQFDAWRNQNSVRPHFDLSLGAGNHQVVYEYRQSSGPAAVSLNWDPLRCFVEVPQEQWRGEYFNNDALNGSPAMVRNDGEAFINYNWGKESPALACGVRQKGILVVLTMMYVLTGGDD